MIEVRTEHVGWAPVAYGRGSHDRNFARDMANGVVGIRGANNVRVVRYEMTEPSPLTLAEEMQ